MSKWLTIYLKQVNGAYAFKPWKIEWIATTEDLRFKSELFFRKHQETGAEKSIPLVKHRRFRQKAAGKLFCATICPDSGSDLVLTGGESGGAQALGIKIRIVFFLLKYFLIEKMKVIFYNFFSIFSILIKVIKLSKQSRKKPDNDDDDSDDDSEEDEEDEKEVKEIEEDEWETDTGSSEGEEMETWKL